MIGRSKRKKEKMGFFRTFTRSEFTFSIAAGKAGQTREALGMKMASCVVAQETLVNYNLSPEKFTNFVCFVYLTAFSFIFSRARKTFVYRIRERVMFKIGK